MSSDTRNFLSNAGAFHVAVEICGTEWSYGYAETEGLGIFYHEPRKCPNHSFVKAIYLGDCKKKTQERFCEWVAVVAVAVAVAAVVVLVVVVVVVFAVAVAAACSGGAAAFS